MGASAYWAAAGLNNRMAWRKRNEEIIACTACPRLRAHCEQVAEEKRRAFRHSTYWGAPVPDFGDARAQLLLVGLAPAAHGANRTGRMFTGDRSGDWLFRALHKSGFANQAEAVSQTDGLQLINCAITAVCHCAPPANKPTPEEIRNCRPWLSGVIDDLQPRVILALGRVAFKAVLDQAYEREWLSGKRPKFGHAVEVASDAGPHLLGSYHPSQQNTFTGRLTEEMFDAVFARAQQLLLAKRPVRCQGERL